MKKSSTTPPKSFSAAQEELEQILQALQEPDSDIDSMVDRVARAKVLIDWSREKLRDTETQINKLIDQ